MSSSSRQHRTITYLSLSFFSLFHKPLKRFLQHLPFRLGEHWLENNSLTKLGSQNLFCQLRDTGIELLWAQTHGPGEKQNVSLPIFPLKEFSLSHAWSLFVDRRLIICQEHESLTSKINLELTESNSEGCASNRQRSTRIFHAKHTWNCSFQNHGNFFSVVLCGLFFLFFFFYLEKL